MDKPGCRNYAGVRDVYQVFQDERISGCRSVRAGLHADKGGGGQVPETEKTRAETTRSSRPSGHCA